MSKPDTSIDCRILNSAKAEFLKNGYFEASLKTICQNAGVTTGALYKRYSGKEDLYCALVSAVALKFKDKIRDQSGQGQLLCGNRESTILDYTEFVYENLDAFKLLLKYSSGTAYCGYLNELVNLMIGDMSGIHISPDKQVSPELWRMIAKAYLSGFFEPVFQDMSLEDAKVYEIQFVNFFKAGWKYCISENEQSI